MTWNVRKLISPPFQCLSITNRVLSLFDRFTAYFNCKSRSDTKLISPWFQCRSIRNRVLSLLDRFAAYYNCMSGNLKILVFRDFSAQVSQIVFLAYFNGLRLITTVWPEMLQKLISPPFQCTNITNHYFRLFDRFTSLLQLYELKSQKTGISVISVHKYHKSCS